MKPRERQDRILEMLRAYQTEMAVEEIAALFHVSPLTVRRDLDVLTDEQAIIRTHGGCLAAGRAALQTEYLKKVAQNFQLKKAIATTAIEFVDKGSVVLMNDGTTTFHVGLRVGQIGSCTIYTNSLAMIAEYNRFTDTRLYLLPGEYDDQRYSLVGGLTEQLLENLSFDFVFLGTESVDEEGRCLVRTPEEARLASLMLRSGRKKILVADYTKVLAGGNIAYGRLHDFDHWVTCGRISGERLEAYTSQTDIRFAPLQRDQD